ncbi:MAG TPA: EcsC family protein [Ktedonobacterales bacterium]|nr:EcsC family protein [Ktedonobacterales bacterium]
MASSNASQEYGGVSALAAQAISALPPDFQELLKPGKTPDRIQRAISWASKSDPEVLRFHRSRGHKVQRIEDIRQLAVAQDDRVAKHFARKFRHRAFLTGAITGLPGGLWALVAAGADVQLTAVYAVRMAADIAQSYGYDTGLPEEQAHLAEVLALAAGIDSLRGIGNWLTREGLIHALPEILPKVLVKVSVELTKEQAAKLVGRIIPGIGAAVGGAIDYTFLRVAGDRAIAYYHQRFLVDHGLALAESVPVFAPATTMRPANVVNGSVAASRPAGQIAGAAAPAAMIAAPRAQPAKPLKHRRSAPERFAIYFAIFSFFALLITTAACIALGYLVVNGIQSLFMH